MAQDRLCKRYVFPSKGGPWGAIGDSPLTSITIRQLDGRDELRAAREADQKGTATTFAQELIKLSIVAVNDEWLSADEIPYEPFDRWNAKTRQLVGKAFSRLNTPSDEEDGGFFASERDA